MASATTGAATKELARLMAAAESAKRVAGERQAELSERRAELARLREAQREYLHATGAGAKRDEPLERRLAAALSEPGLVEREGALTDTMAEARLDGAREAHEAAQRELREFCGDHLAELDAELRRGEAAEREAVLAAARDLARAMHPVRQRWRRVHGVFVLAGRPAEAPRPPFDAAARALAAMERE